MGYNFFNKKHCTNVKERIIPREFLDLKLETKQQYVIYTDGSFIAKESEPKMEAAFI